MSSEIKIDPARLGMLQQITDRARAALAKAGERKQQAQLTISRLQATLRGALAALEQYGGHDPELRSERKRAVDSARSAHDVAQREFASVAAEYERLAERSRAAGRLSVSARDFLAAREREATPAAEPETGRPRFLEYDFRPISRPSYDLAEDEIDVLIDDAAEGGRP